MDTWQPVTANELESLVAVQLGDCSLEQQPLFERCRVALRLASIDRAGNVESVFVVAQARGLVMYYDDVEEGFNLSPLSPNGVIASPGYEQWELRHALGELLAA